MSECTSKLQGWVPQGKPMEGPELERSRELIRSVIFSKFFEKKARLAQKGWPVKPISLAKIFKEVESRIESLRSIRDWPYPHHEKRWWDRRCNEVATPKYYSDGITKIVFVRAGLYQPNPQLFNYGAKRNDKMLFRYNDDFPYNSYRRVEMTEWAKEAILNRSCTQSCTNCPELSKGRRSAKIECRLSGY